MKPAAPLTVVFGCLVVAVLTALAPLSQGASSSGGTVVGATVPKSTKLDTTGCMSPGALEFGAVVPGSFPVNDTCTIGFSGNAPSQLRMWQRDQRAPALEDSEGGYTTLLGSNNLWAVAASSIGKAWVGGQGGPGFPSGYLIHTNDSGASWQAQTPCKNRQVEDIAAINDSTAFLIAADKICVTSDGGATWTTDYTSPDAPTKFEKLDMDSATDGWTTSGDKVYRRTGSGWAAVYTDSLFGKLYDISSDGAGHVTVVGVRSSSGGSDYGSVSSNDNGVTWTRQIHATSPGYDSFGGGGALQLNATTAIAGHSRGMWRTTDAGGTWTKVDNNAPYGTPVQAPDGTVYVPTSGDYVRRSTDAGVTFSALALGTGITANNWAVAAVGDELWLSGEADLIARKPAGSTTWAQAGIAVPALRAVATWDANRWIAAGDNGSARRTTDGGTTLINETIGTRTLRAGMGLANGVGIMVGESSTIMRTSDYGVTWSSVASPAVSSWGQITRDDEGRIWIAGTSGYVALSTDQGASWTLQTTIPGGVDVMALSAWDGVIWAGADGGNAWKSAITPPTAAAKPLVWNAVATGTTKDISGVWAIDAQTAILVTNELNSQALRTTDGGATFTAQLVGDYAEDVSAVASSTDRSHAWISLRFGQVLESRDGGLTWIGPVNLSDMNYAGRVEPIDHNRVVVVGRNQGLAVSGPTKSVPDGIPASGSGFGVCLATSTGTTATTWAPAGVGNCTSAAALGLWHPIPVLPDAGSIIASAPAGAASVDLNFGLRIGSGQAVAAYAADIAIEVIAP